MAKYLHVVVGISWAFCHWACARCHA